MKQHVRPELAVRFTIRAKNVDYIKFYRAADVNFPQYHIVVYVHPHIDNMATSFINLFADIIIEVVPLDKANPYDLKLKILDYKGKPDTIPETIIPFIEGSED